jgi:endonuclease/exonuclease/phosphatase family metal-dependent hydrolase
MKVKIVITLLFVFISLNSWSQPNTENPKIIRVLTFNILHGATTKGDFDLDLIAKVINDANPDFVALQEVDFKTNRAKKYDLVTELGYRTKLSPLFGKAMKFDGGEYGEGVLSKYSFVNTRSVALPYSAGNEPRAALEITSVLLCGDTVSFVGTHLDHLKDAKDRKAQVRKINEVFSTNKYPTILAGDLNDVPGSEAINELEEIWVSAYDKSNPLPTFPSDNPRIKIDYVMFYPKNRWKVLSTEVIQDAFASDHCAYLVTVELLEN